MPQECPYIAIEDCTNLAFEYLKKAKVHVTDDDVQSLAEAIAISMKAWFGDMKHLTPNYRPGPTR